MSDVRLFWDPERRSGDFQMDGGDLARGFEIETALLISLFCHRGQWWANPNLGSRLHEFVGEPFTPQILNDLKGAVEEATQWFVDDGVVGSIEASVVKQDEWSGVIRLEVTQGEELLVYEFVWSSRGAA